MADLAADKIVPMEREIEKSSKKIRRLSIRLEKKIDSTICIICYQKKRDVVLFNCSHFAVCQVCAGKLNGFCPLCRQKITSWTVVKIA